MMEELALVIDRADAPTGKIWVRTQRKKACDSCQMRAACGQQTLVRLLSKEQGLEWLVANPLRAKPGDVVVMQVPESGVLGASLILYIWPLFTMLLLAMLAAQLWPDAEAIQVLAGLSGLGVGVALAARFARQREQEMQYQPAMARFAVLQCPGEGRSSELGVSHDRSTEAEPQVLSPQSKLNNQE